MLLGGKITGDANRQVWDVGSIETAQEFANVFMRNNIPTAKYSASSTGTTTSSVSVINPIGKVVQSPVMYAVSQDSAWVLVSADERVTPILAYSDANTGMENANDNRTQRTISFFMDDPPIIR